MRECERCNSLDDNVSEVSFAAGNHAMLCDTCRVDWLRRARRHPMGRDYELTDFALACVLTRMEATGDDLTDEAMTLKTRLMDFDDQLFELGQQWLGEFEVA